MSWNYRVVRRVDDGELHLGIHEVYYTDGVPHSVTVEPVSVCGGTVKELDASLDRMREALGKPVLDFDEIGSAENKKS